MGDGVMNMRAPLKRVLGFVVEVALVFGASFPIRANVLSGTDSFDISTGLYTYSYILNNSGGTEGVNELAILVASPNKNFSLVPNAHSSPAGWDFLTAISGNIENPPVNEVGTFWRWFQGGSGLSVGNVLSGFSFSTTAAPTSSTSNNYFLYSSSLTGGPPGLNGVFEFGHVVAPALVPEPASTYLLGLGLAAFSVMGLRRRGLRRA